MNLKISESFNKENLHHAYLVEGAQSEILPQILELVSGWGIQTSGNPDFYSISIDSFKIDEAFDLRRMGQEKGAAKKIFVICTNSISPDAQNVLLKLFEEPIKNTHFFVVVPEIDSLIKTLISRFYVIKAAPTPKGIGAPTENVGEKFIAMPLRMRIEFLKELLAEPDEDNDEIISQNSSRAKALHFLNALETALHSKLNFNKQMNVDFFEHIFKTREFLRQPGSSAKMLMESVALSVPTI